MLIHGWLSILRWMCYSGMRRGLSMIGKLDPDERVLEEPDYSPWKEGGIMDMVQEQIKKLGWETGDEISVELGGTQVSGIDVGEVYNKKWQSPKGTRKYNKDCFIIIKNQSRRDLSKSQPMEEFKPHHSLNNSDTVETEDDISGVHAGVIPESNPSEG